MGETVASETSDLVNVPPPTVEVECYCCRMSVDQQVWERQWLPLWPLASDDLRTGIYRMSRDSALGLKYIEVNPHAVSNLLVVDIDHEDAILRAMWNRKTWLPNAVVENPSNGHAHAVWALQEPITRTEYAHRKPLAYAAAVTEGLRRSVDGDQGYSGLITKNPTHKAWEASWLTDHLYELDELREHLYEAGFMPPPSWTRSRRKKPVGLGRNCDIFESARTWAYRAARQIRLRHEHPTGNDYEAFHQAVRAHVAELNAEYSEPLPSSEAKAITESIYRWVTTRFTGWTDSRTVNQATFIAIQSARGHKSIAVRQAEQRRNLERVLS